MQRGTPESPGRAGIEDAGLLQEHGEASPEEWYEL